MVKHNNIIPNSHFRKDWQRFIKTNFDQPVKKQQRRAARTAKAKAMAPRPVGMLRPVVRCQTQKYNIKIRPGRGFTLAELKAAGVNPKQAASIGIAVDYRRVNKSEESLATNVQRLKEYTDRLIVFPRRGKHKQGDASKEEFKLAGEQVTDKNVLPLPSRASPKTTVEFAPVPDQEKTGSVVAQLRKANKQEKKWGARRKILEKRTK